MRHFLNFKTSVTNAVLLLVLFVTTYTKFTNALHVVAFLNQIRIDKTCLGGGTEKTGNPHSETMTSPSPAEGFWYHWDISCFNKQP